MRRGSTAAEPAHRRFSWPTAPANRGRPLEGTKVLDLTRVLAGPFCAMQLADLGADVIKVEPPSGDETRRWGPPFFQGTAAYFFGANRNKWDIALDLTTPQDRELLGEVLREADVVLQNFTRDTATKFGVDYDSVAAINPRVVHLTLTAFGPGQPDRRGYDLILQALGGMMAITGDPAGGPAKTGVPISDLAAALYATSGIASALAARERTGHGARLDVALYDSILALLANQSMSWLLCRADTPRLGMDHPVLAPYGAYQAADQVLVLAVGSDAQFAKLCEVVGRPDLARDPMFGCNADRVAHRKRLREVLETVLAARPAADWGLLLDRVGVPNAIIRTVPEALSAAECRTVTAVDSATWGSVPQVMNPIQVNGTYLTPYLAPPRLDEHRNLILRRAPVVRDKGGQ